MPNERLEQRGCYRHGLRKRTQRRLSVRVRAATQRAAVLRHGRAVCVWRRDVPNEPRSELPGAPGAYQRNRIRGADIPDPADFGQPVQRRGQRWLRQQPQVAR